MSIGQSGEKPKKPYEELGQSATVSVTRGEKDPWAQATLKEIGKSMTREGHNYLGSAAFHIYATPKVNLMGQSHILYAHQIALGETNELISQHAMIEFSKEIAAYYGHMPSTNDPNYKVKP